MKYVMILMLCLVTSVAHADRPRWIGGGDQNNRQTVRQNVDQNQRQQQQQQQRQATQQSQTATGGTGGNGGTGGQGGTGGTSNSWSDANSNSDSYSDANSSATNDGNNTAINYENDYKDTYREYVAPAYAPALTSTGDCLGSASAGGSNSVMGFSLGKTYVDENCNARYDAILLHQLGRHSEAIMRLCSQPEMAKVLSECPQPEEPETVVMWD